uniref:Uncharacterized protein n=1 Tax=Rhizophora mucronata TaxID=61149 RepID=A0A2P2NDE3_RHIMU
MNVLDLKKKIWKNKNNEVKKILNS